MPTSAVLDPTGEGDPSQALSLWNPTHSLLLRAGATATPPSPVLVCAFPYSIIFLSPSSSFVERGKEIPGPTGDSTLQFAELIHIQDLPGPSRRP